MHHPRPPLAVVLCGSAHHRPLLPIARPLGETTTVTLATSNPAHRVAGAEQHIVLYCMCRVVLCCVVLYCVVRVVCVAVAHTYNQQPPSAISHSAISSHHPHKHQFQHPTRYHQSSSVPHPASLYPSQTLSSSDDVLKSELPVILMISGEAVTFPNISQHQ